MIRTEYSFPLHISNIQQLRLADDRDSRYSTVIFVPLEGDGFMTPDRRRMNLLFHDADCEHLPWRSADGDSIVDCITTYFEVEVIEKCDMRIDAAEEYARQKSLRTQDESRIEIQRRDHVQCAAGESVGGSGSFQLSSLTARPISDPSWKINVIGCQYAIVIRCGCHEGATTARQPGDARARIVADSV